MSVSALSPVTYINEHQLQRIAVYAPRMRILQMVDPINLALPIGEINTAGRLAMFLAQITHETADFAFFTELWGNTTAQKRYEGRADLGNVEEGDGFRYRGRGAIQLTGRKNYEEAGLALGLPLIDVPNLAALPEHAFKIAAWWWARHKCNAPADQGDVEGCTKIINGGFNGLMDRLIRYDRAIDALGLLPAV